RPPQPGHDQRFAPDGPGDDARPSRPNGRPGAFTPGAGFAAARSSREPAGWDGDDEFLADESADPWPPEAASRPARGHGASSPNKNRNIALVAGAGVLSTIAIIGVIVAPKVLGPSDPGCKAYAGPALTAYNKTIHDLNAQAPQSVLSADMSA